MIRPNCNRCKYPLDVFEDPEDGWVLGCNNLHKQSTPVLSEEQFQKVWKIIPEKDKLKLLREINEKST